VTVLAVAIAYWTMLGAAPPTCLHLRLADLRAPTVGKAQVGGCDAWIARRLLPARNRRGVLRVCQVTIHEVGHTIGLGHASGIMAATYRPGHEPGICWRLHPPITCIVCRPADQLDPAET
jgi:hypothetical protein